LTPAPSIVGFVWMIRLTGLIDTVVPPAVKTLRVYNGCRAVSPPRPTSAAPLAQIDNLFRRPLASASSNTVRETNVDVNRLAASPIERVTANPRIGPVPN
jgi:hypothetical protein